MNKDIFFPALFAHIYQVCLLSDRTVSWCQINVIPNQIFLIFKRWHIPGWNDVPISVVGKAAHKLHRHLKPKLAGHLTIRSEWVHMAASTFCMSKKTQAHFCRVKPSGKAWLRSAALLEIERLRILWAAGDLEASSLLINLWQEVSLSALCAMLLIYMLIWIQSVAGISSMASFQSLSIPPLKQFTSMFGNAKPLEMLFFLGQVIYFEKNISFWWTKTNEHIFLYHI